MTEPHLRDFPARTYVGDRSQVPMAQLAATIDAGFPKLFARAGAPTGAPFIRYHGFEEILDIELGVPTAQGDRELPAGEYATVTHFGPYEELPAVHDTLRAWAKDQGLTLGDSIEVYETDPREEPDKAKWRTEVSYLVTP